MNLYVNIALGIVMFFLAFYLLRHAEKIRNSSYWFMGYFGYLFFIIMGFKFLSPLIDKVNIDDNIAVPVLIGTVVLIIAIMYFWQLRKFRRRIN